MNAYAIERGGLELAADDIGHSLTIDGSGISARNAPSTFTAMREAMHGTLNSALVCPHCQTSGRVRTQKVEQKGGLLSALFTGGLSLLVSPRDTLAWCGHCKAEWRIAK